MKQWQAQITGCGRVVSGLLCRTKMRTQRLIDVWAVAEAAAEANMRNLLRDAAIRRHFACGATSSVVHLGVLIARDTQLPVMPRLFQCGRLSDAQISAPGTVFTACIRDTGIMVVGWRRTTSLRQETPLTFSGRCAAEIGVEIDTNTLRTVSARPPSRQPVNAATPECQGCHRASQSMEFVITIGTNEQ